MVRTASAIAGMGPRGWALSLGTAALLVRLPLLAMHHDLAPGSDSPFYLSLSDDILHGRGFSRAGEFYTPGYPATMAMLRLVPGRTEDALAIFQHLVGVGVVMAIVLAGWRYFGRVAALGAGTLAALGPMMATHEHALLPDFLFGALVLAGGLLLAEAVTRFRAPLLLLALSGVSFGAAAWIKPAGQFLLVAPPVALLLTTRSWRQTLRGSAIVAMALVVTISPWLLRNTHFYGFPSMSNQGGQTLFNRAFEVDRLPFPSDSRHASLARKVEADVARRPGARFTSAFHDALVRERSLDSDKAIAVQLDLALTAIWRHPGTYAVGTLRDVARSDSDMKDLDQDEQDFRDELRRKRPAASEIATATWSVSRILAVVWWVASLAGAAALLLPFTGEQRSRRAAVALLSVWFAVIVGTALAHGQLWRYSMQVAPIGWLLGSAGAVAMVTELASRARRRRRAA